MRLQSKPDLTEDQNLSVFFMEGSVYFPYTSGWCRTVLGVLPPPALTYGGSKAPPVREGAFEKVTKSGTRLIHSFLDVRTMLKDLWQSMDKVCLIEVECVRKEFQGERCSHSFSQTLSLVLYKQSQSQCPKTPPCQHSNDYADGNITKKMRMDVSKVPCTKIPKTPSCQQQPLFPGRSSSWREDPSSSQHGLPPLWQSFWTCKGRKWKWIKWERSWCVTRFFVFLILIIVLLSWKDKDVAHLAFFTCFFNSYFWCRGNMKMLLTWPSGRQSAGWSTSFCSAAGQRCHRGFSLIVYHI